MRSAGSAGELASPAPHPLVADPLLATPGREAQAARAPGRQGLLRREAPVFRYEREGIDPFHAVTRHEGVLEVSKRSDVFVNSRRLRLQTREEDERQRASTRARIAARGWDSEEPSDFILMDDPRHRDFRLLVAKRFTPAALRKLERHFAELARGFAVELEAELARTERASEACDDRRAGARLLPRG